LFHNQTKINKYKLYLFLVLGPKQRLPDKIQKIVMY